MDTVKEEFGCLECFFFNAAYTSGWQDVLPLSTQKKGVGMGNKKSLGVQDQAETTPGVHLQRKFFVSYIKWNKKCFQFGLVQAKKK